MKKKGKIITVVVILIVIILAAALLIWRFVINKDSASSGRIVYVESVKDITGISVGLDSRYMGVVESQETKGIEKDADKTVKEIYVQEGDSVNEGDELFAYDTQDMELQLQQLELELEVINNDISSYTSQINDLTTQREQAPAEDKLSYTSQIQNLQAQLKQSQYNLSVKQLEIDRQKESIEGAVILSPMTGVIKTINENTTQNDYYDSSTDNSFITIMATGDYRIKGTISELDNLYSLMEGTPVIVRSRVDENVTWNGTIDKIDLDNGADSDNINYGDSMGESATKYSFYVILDNYDGLMLGQHLYIEMDYGQGSVGDGLWLPSYYMVMDGTENYVWAEGSNGKIEKRVLTLGEYNEEMDLYEVISGIDENDYIAYPEEDIEEGMETTTDYEVAMESTQDMNSEEDMLPDDGMDMIDEEIYIPEDGEIIDEQIEEITEPAGGE